MPAALLSRARHWATFVIVSVGVLVVLDQVVAVMAPADWYAHSLAYAVANVGAAAAIAYGIRLNRPEASAAWWLFAAAVFLRGVANLVTFNAQRAGEHGFSSAAMSIQLGQGLLVIVGLLLLIRHRTPGWDLPSLVDASIVAVSATLLAWVYLIDPQTAGGTTLSARLFSGAVPTVDLLLIVVGARLMLGAGARSPSLRLLAGYFLVLLAADSSFAVAVISGGFRPGGWSATLWAGSGILLGAAALHPTMRLVDQRATNATPDVTPGRLALLAGAALLAPATLVVQDLRSGALHVMLVAGCCTVLFLLVVVRLAGVVAVQRHAAITDPLTGLKTRRYFDAALATEAARGARNGTPVSLLILDLDHFKSVNDTYGHDGGDRVLREAARRLTTTLRSGDVLARYGGEEFAVLLAGATTADACQAGERFRTAIAGGPVDVTTRASIGITVSIGVATLTGGSGTTQDLVVRADEQLYRSKAEGRNRVSAAEPELTSV